MRPTSPDAGRPRTRPAPEPTPLPLSPGQEGVALQQRAAPGSAIFNIPAAVELAGDLDEAALRRALTDLIARHDVLRATFSGASGVLVQTVQPPRPAQLPIRDLRHLPVSDRDSALRAILGAEAARPFDLAHETGLRCLLVTTGDRRHVFFWMMHHIVCDGWSKSILARDLSRLYDAHRAGTPPDLPELPARYGDFVAWQLALPPHVIEAQLAYWEGQLAGAADLPPLPADLRGHTERSPHGDSIDISISPADTRRLVALAASARATAFMALYACWAVTLSRYCGQADLIIDSPYGGRPAPEFEPLIGFFVNVLPLRVRLHDDPSFRRLLNQVRATALDGYENSQVAFHQIIRRVIKPGGQFAALSQSSLAFANLPYEDIRLAGLDVSRYPVIRTDIRFPLEVQMWEGLADGAVKGRLIYRTDLFTPWTAGVLAAAFSATAREAATRPDIAVSQLDVPLQPTQHDLIPAARHIAEDFATPLTATETVLLDIWEELLHTDEISVTDSFPDIGGHSLLTALMVARIREELGADLPVHVIYRDPTVRGIAAAIASNRQPQLSQASSDWSQQT
jgi:hypothetical protein